MRPLERMSVQEWARTGQSRPGLSVSSQWLPVPVSEPVGEELVSPRGGQLLVLAFSCGASSSQSGCGC